MAEHKNSDFLVTAALSFGQPMTAGELSEALLISRENIRDALIRLESEQIIIWPKVKRGLRRPAWINPKILDNLTMLHSNCIAGASQVHSRSKNPQPETAESTLPGSFSEKIQQGVRSRLNTLNKINNSTLSNLINSFFTYLNKETSPVPPKGVRGGILHLVEEMGAAPADRRSASVVSVASLKRGLSPEPRRSGYFAQVEEKLRRIGWLDRTYFVKPATDMKKAAWGTMLMRSDDNCFPYYVGLPNIVKDIAFARAYGAVFKRFYEWGDRHGIYMDAVIPERTVESQSLIYWQRGRIWADYNGAKYEDWCEAIIEKYKDKPTEYTKIAFPRYLAGTRAREIYGKYFDDKSRIDRMKRLEIEILDQELLPENCRGTERQNDYYNAVMSEIERIAEHNGRAIEKVIGEYITDGIMSKRFAENPEFNWRCKDYHYEAPTSKYYEDFIKIPGR